MGSRTKNEEGDAFPPGMGKPAIRALETAGYTRLAQLTQVTEAELLQLHGMGPKAIGILREALKAAGKPFAQPDETRGEQEGAQTMATKPSTIDEYLAALSDDKRAALEKLRKAIRAAAPDAEECISYQLPAFRHNGVLVAFGATANHCAFYLMSASTVEAHKGELKDYDTSKGTIRFQADKPLPVALVRKLVKARVAENVGRRGE